MIKGNKKGIIFYSSSLHFFWMKNHFMHLNLVLLKKYTGIIPEYRSWSSDHILNGSGSLITSIKKK